MHRRFANACRYAGFSASVSTRALIMRLPTLGSFAQKGTSPQVTTRSWRGPSGRSSTAYTGLVGATL